MERIVKIKTEESSAQSTGLLRLEFSEDLWVHQGAVAEVCDYIPGVSAMPQRGDTKKLSRRNRARDINNLSTAESSGLHIES